MPGGGNPPQFRPHGDPLRGHDGRVVEVAFSPDGARLASASVDETVRLWDPYSGEETAVLRGHTNRVLSVAFHPTEDLLASGGRAADSSVRLWNTRSGEEVETFWSGNDSVWSVAFSPDGTRLAAGVQSDGVKLWDLTSRTEHELTGHHGTINVVAFGPNGTLAAAGDDATVLRWAPDGAALPSFSGQGQEIRALACALDGSLAFGDLSGRIEVHRPYVEPSVLIAEEARTGVWSATFSPDGSLIASTHEDGYVRIWDVRTAELVGDPLAGPDEGKAIWVAFSPQGNLIAAACDDGTVRLWAQEPSPRPMTIESRPPYATVRAHTGGVTALAFSGDGALLLSGGADGAVRRRSTTTLEPLGDPITLDVLGEEPHGEVRSAALSRSSLTAAARWDDGSFCWWAVGRRGEPYLFAGAGTARSIAVSSYGRFLAVARVDGGLTMWTTRQQSRSLVDPSADLAPVNTLAFSPDDSMLAVGDDNGVVRLISPDDGQVLREIDIGSPVTCFAFSPDGSALVVGDMAGIARAWDLRADGVLSHVGRRRPDAQAGAITAVTISALTGQVGLLYANGSLHFHNGTWTGVAIDDPVSALAFSPDGRLLAVGTRAGDIGLWEMEAPPEPERPVEVVVTMDADVASRVDRLEMRREARGLARVLTARDTGTPFAVALLGDWGSGKSTFMYLLDAEIADLSEDATKLVVRKRDLHATPFCAGIRTVAFNAWHYADDHLWAGLIRHILGELSGHPTVDAAEQDIADRERTDLETKITEARIDLAAVETDLLASESPPRTLRFFRWLVDKPDTFEAAHQAARGVRRRLRRIGWIAALAVVVGLGGAAAVAATDALDSWVAVVLTAVGAVGAATSAVHRVLVTSLNEWRSKLQEIADAAIGGAPLPGHEAQVARRSALATRIEQLEADLAATDPERRLTRFLHDRRDSGDYAAYRGLLSLVHDDLEEMTKLIDKHVKAWPTTTTASAPPLQRVVLYIDDLDRCEPKRVVEVLAAIHLILAMRLFVVVVAVDPNWLLRCLRHHYVELLDTADDDKKLGVHAGTPIAYLEKIFQVAYQLPPMDAGLSTLVDSLMPLRRSDSDAEDGDEATTEESARSTAQLDDLTSTPRPPLELDVVDPTASADTQPVVFSETTASIQVNDHDPESRPQASEVESAEIESIDSRPLDFSAEEIAMVVGLGPIVQTPRTLKRLVNVYRVIRATIADVDEQRLADEHGYVLLLLAVALGQPLGAPWFFATVSTSDEDDLVAALESAPAPPAARSADTLPAPTAEVLTQLRQDVTKVITDSKLPLTHLPTYRTWLPIITRYTFRHRHPT